MQDLEVAMQKALEAAKRNFSGVRTGRANPGLIENMHVDYYGSKMPLKSLASISIPDARQLMINPFDKGAVQAIEKAISMSDLGVTPQTAGDSIRIVLPPLTEDRRKDLYRMVRGMGEESKVSIRNARHEAIDKIKKQEKDKEITEDEFKALQDVIQKKTDKYCHEIDELLKKKEVEILET